MKYMYTIVMLAATVLASTACGDGDVQQPGQDHDPCGGWSPDPQEVGKACVSDGDCGDPGVCMHAACVDGGCAYETAPAGMQCAQCNVFGACDGAGTCVSISKAQASDACVDGPAYTLDELEGSCFRLWCMGGSVWLLEKAAGVPCVVNIDGLASFYQGQCYPGGECR